MSKVGDKRLGQGQNVSKYTKGTNGDKLIRRGDRDRQGQNVARDRDRRGQQGQVVSRRLDRDKQDDIN